MAFVPCLPAAISQMIWYFFNLGADHLVGQFLGYQNQHNGGHRQNSGTHKTQSVLTSGVIEVSADLGANKGTDTVANKDQSVVLL